MCHAARMFRFDLLRVVNPLMSEVSRWARGCVNKWFSVLCCINTTLDMNLASPLGDSILNCRLLLLTFRIRQEHPNSQVNGRLIPGFGQTRNCRADRRSIKRSDRRQP